MQTNICVSNINLCNWHVLKFFHSIKSCLLVDLYCLPLGRGHSPKQRRRQNQSAPHFSSLPPSQFRRRNSGVEPVKLKAQNHGAPPMEGEVISRRTRWRQERRTIPLLDGTKTPMSRPRWKARRRRRRRRPFVCIPAGSLVDRDLGVIFIVAGLQEVRSAVLSLASSSNCTTARRWPGAKAKHCVL